MRNVLCITSYITFKYDLDYKRNKTKLSEYFGYRKRGILQIKILKSNSMLDFFQIKFIAQKFYLFTNTIGYRNKSWVFESKCRFDLKQI